MRETFLFTGVFLAVFVIFFLCIWFFIIKRMERRTKRQKKFFDGFIERSNALYEKFGYNEASRFISRYATTIIEFPSEIFIGREFKEIKLFISNLGEDYDDETKMSFILQGKCMDKDLEKLKQLLIQAILDPHL